MEYIDENSPQIINQGYKIWKKNVPALYNILQTYELESTSQTVEWLTESFVEDTWKCMKLFIGTNTISNNAVYQLNVYIPTNESVVDVSDYNEVKPQQQVGNPGYVGTMGQQNLDIKHTLYQDSEVMKIRVSKADPTRENLVAVKTGGSHPEIILYNLSHQDNQLETNKIYLTGHDAQGYGISWNNLQSNILASCSYDKKILIWDVNQAAHQVAPLKEIKTNEYLQEVKWMHGNANLFAVSSQNKTISIYDMRENTSKPAITKTAHSGEIYSLDFNRFAQNLLLSGGEDSDVYLWDIRNMSKKYNSFIGHNDSVTCLQWSNYHETTFVSGSADRKIVVWDISQIGSQMTTQQKQSQNKTDQVRFIHNGHRSRVTDLSFSTEQNLVASCEENNTMQVWQMSENFSHQN